MNKEYIIKRLEEIKCSEIKFTYNMIQRLIFDIEEGAEVHEE